MCVWGKRSLDSAQTPYTIAEPCALEVTPGSPSKDRILTKQGATFNSGDKQMSNYTGFV